MYGWLALWIYLIVIGTFFRGPNWNFYGPFEWWDPHKLVVLNNVNLSEYVWIKLLNKGLPANKITAFAGESATGKTFFVMGICKNFLDSNPDAGVIYFESESAIYNHKDNIITFYNIQKFQFILLLL